MSDHGTQFTSVSRESCKNPKPNIFQKTLQELEVKHIKARIKPQSNGKLERVTYTLKRYYKHFGSWGKTIRTYNFKRPHTNLEINGRICTPYQAYLEKLKRRGVEYGKI